MEGLLLFIFFWGNQWFLKTYDTDSAFYDLKTSDVLKLTDLEFICVLCMEFVC
jgi:hypothetical protein